MVISSLYINQAMKTSLFGILALLVLAVSLPSAFAQTSDSPIQMVLDLTKENLLETLDSAGEIPFTAQTFYDLGEEEYQKAIDALNNGDFEAAEEHAIIAMALFEDSTEEIGEFEGFEDDDIDIPSGITEQFTSSNIFEVQEEITGLDFEFEELKELAESNDLEFDFTEFEETISSAYEDLANGNTDGAKEQLGSIENIAEAVYEQMNEKAIEDQEERAEEFGEELAEKIEEALDQDLGLTEDSIEQMEATLEALQTGDAETIIASTGENSEFAKQVEENEIEEELGEPETETDEAETETDEGAESASQQAASDAESASQQAASDAESASQQAASDAETETDEGAETETDEGAETETDGDSFDAGLGDSFENKGHDYYEDAFEASVDDDFEENYDGTLGGVDGKGLLGNQEVAVSSSSTITSSGSTNSNLYITSGQSFTVQSGQTINGNLIMTGGTLIINAGATIEGNVEVTGGSLTTNGGLITGNVDVVNSDPATIQNTNINGNIEVANSLNVLISNNTVNGSILDLGGNTGCNVFGNTYGGINTFMCTTLVAVDDLAYSAQNPGFVVISVLANDGGTGLFVTGVTQGSTGSVGFTATTATYTPNGSVSGDTFTYTIQDGSIPPNTGIGTVTVIVDDYTNIISGNAGGFTVLSSQHWLVWNGATISGDITVDAGELTLATGTTVSGNIKAAENTNAKILTIDESTITGNVEVDTAEPVTITDSTVDGSIQLKDSTNITITGTTLNNDMVDNNGNINPCDISNNFGSGGGTSVSCSGGGGGGGSPETITLSGATDSASGVLSPGDLAKAQTNDTDRWETVEGANTSYEFTNPTIPGGATII